MGRVLGRDRGGGRKWQDRYGRRRGKNEVSEGGKREIREERRREGTGWVTSGQPVNQSELIKVFQVFLIKVLSGLYSPVLRLAEEMCPLAATTVEAEVVEDEMDVEEEKLFPDGSSLLLWRKRRERKF